MSGMPNYNNYNPNQQPYTYNPNNYRRPPAPRPFYNAQQNPNSPPPQQQDFNFNNPNAFTSPNAMPSQSFTPQQAAPNNGQLSAELAQLQAMANQLKPLGIDFDVNAVGQMVSAGMPMEQAVMKQMEASGLPLGDILGGGMPNTGMNSVPSNSPLGFSPSAASPESYQEDPSRSGPMIARNGAVWDTKSNAEGMGFFSKLLITAAVLAIGGYGFKKFALAQNETLQGALKSLNNNSVTDYLKTNSFSQWVGKKTPQSVKDFFTSTGQMIKNALGFGDEAAAKVVTEASK